MREHHPSEGEGSAENGRAVEKPRSRRMYYLCFQVTREGQASHAHVNEILRGLERRGWRTKLFQPSHAGGRETSLWQKLTSSFLPQWQLWTTRPSPDVLYYRMHPAALPSVVWARLRGIPTIGEVNGTIADLRLVYPRLLPIAPVIYQVCLACLRLSSSLITVTKPLAEWLRTKAGRVPVHVVPNGANTDLFRPDASPGANRAHPYVVFVGAMSPWQGIDTLLAAVDRPEWPEQVRLVFVGDGMARPAVQRAAERNARVVYYGQLPHRSISGILAASLAGLSTQNGKRGDAARYGFSAMKVFETMACGTPVIVTDFPGQGEVVREAGAGIVIQPEDAAGVASAVSFLYANPGVAAKMGARGREAAERFHTWQHRADQTDRIILELIDAESGTRSSADPTTAHRNQA